jgi:hypothetical protein
MDGNSGIHEGGTIYRCEQAKGKVIRLRSEPDQNWKSLPCASGGESPASDRSGKRQNRFLPFLEFVPPNQSLRKHGLQTRRQCGINRLPLYGSREKSPVGDGDLTLAPFASPRINVSDRKRASVFLQFSRHGDDGDKMAVDDRPAAFAFRETADAHQGWQSFVQGFLEPVVDPVQQLFLGFAGFEKHHLVAHLGQIKPRRQLVRDITEIRDIDAGSRPAGPATEVPGRSHGHIADDAGKPLFVRLPRHRVASPLPAFIAETKGCEQGGWATGISGDGKLIHRLGTAIRSLAHRLGHRERQAPGDPTNVPEQWCKFQPGDC